MKKLLRALLFIVLVLVIVVGGYVAYVFIDYHRIDPDLELEVAQRASGALGLVDSAYFA